MTAPNPSFTLPSPRKLFALVALALLLFGARVADAQNLNNNGNTNAAGGQNTALPPATPVVTPTAAASPARTASPSPTQTPTPAQTPSPTPDPSVEARRTALVNSIWFPLLIAGLFAVVLIPFSRVIWRAVKFSRATYGPFGLPEGSLRAMLAFVLVAYLGFYVVASVLSFSEFKPPEFLIGVVATVIGFYFGSRSGEDRGAASPKTGDVQGRVTGSDGAAAAGATVELSRTGGKKLTATSDAEGNYKFDDVAAGEYDIRATLGASSSGDPAKVKVTAGGTETVNLKLK